MTLLPRTAGDWHRLFVIGLFGLAVCFGGPPAQASPLYTITDLGTVPGRAGGR